LHGTDGRTLNEPPTESRRITNVKHYKLHTIQNCQIHITSHMFSPTYLLTYNALLTLLGLLAVSEYR